MKKNPIHQLVHTLSYGDAISSEVLSFQSVFQAEGIESEIYSLHTHPKLEGRTKSIEELSPDFTGEIILHYSLGSPLNDLYASLSKATRRIVYHNLTPSQWFEGVNPRITADIRSGEKELPGLLALSDQIIADSTFNAEEIRQLGFEATVLALPIDPNRWGVEANPGIAQIVSSQPGPHLLHVGRLAPNKCIEDIIRSFYFFRNHISKNSRLWLVGIDIDTELYSFSLKHLVDQLGLRDAVEFPGCLSDGELRALYEQSDLYLCMSEHEGFCLPVIEAMHFGLPVIAYDSSALTETVGDGGIIVRSKDPAYLAGLYDQVLQNPMLVQKLVEAGRKRVSELSFERFTVEVRELFQAPLLKMSHKEEQSDAHCA